MLSESATTLSSRPGHRRRERCRACGSRRLDCALPLGQTPLANSFLASEAEFAAEAWYPLDLYICRDCSLAQLLDVVDPEILFRDYVYVTGISETMATHNQAYAASLSERLSLGPADLVVEIASNDGSLLSCFAPYGARTVGIEPATNIVELARARGVETINRFFDAAAAHELRDQIGAARLLIANNVLAHVDGTRDFLQGCHTLLAEDGRLVVEVPYLRHMLRELQFDTIYHEHLCYFSVTTLMRLCDEVGLSIVEIEHVPVHGGSLRVHAERRSHAPAHAPAVRCRAERERLVGLSSFARYERFRHEVEGVRDELVGLLKQLRAAGKRVAAYGAPAKGNTLLNYCGIGPELVTFTVDRNPLKTGQFTPGMHLPVRPVEAILEEQPDYLLLLAWNFADEIVRQQAEYAARGGRFILPIPRPKVV